MKPHRIFFFLTLILLPTQLGFHFWPEWSLVLGRRLDYLSPTLFLTDITVALTLFFWFQGKKKYFRSSFGYWYYWILVLFVIFNIFFSSSPFLTISKWFKVFELVLFGVYIIKTKPDFSRSIWCLSFAVFYSSIIAIAQFLFQHSIGGALWFLGERTFTIDTPGIARIQTLPISILNSHELLRPYATFPHPNVLGGFLAAMLPLFIIQLSKIKSSVLKVLTIISFILGLVALILTFSRSAWVAACIGLLLVLAYQKKNYWIIGLLVVIGLFICALPYFQTLTPESESVAVRNELNIAAVKMFSSSPVHVVFGVGLGNFLINLPYVSSGRQIFFLQPVHNIYLLLLAETGVIGISLVLFLLWSLSKKLFANRFSFPLLISLSLYLCLGLVDHYPLTLQQGQLFLTILLSLSLVYNKTKS